MADYFTERENGVRPPAEDTINERVWGGIYSLIETRLGDGSFGYRFPEQCPDGNGPCGSDEAAFRRMLLAEVPSIEWPLQAGQVPETPIILDLLEFCARAIGDPIEGSFHSFFGHHHLAWDRASGVARFVNEVNLLFRRNAVAYELDADGSARRRLPAPVAHALDWRLFQTGDHEMDRLLEAAGRKFMSPTTDDRLDALEKLWDAFERMKTLEPGGNKRIQADALLDRAANAETGFRQMLSQEAAELTSIGNTFRIRHAETNQEPISTPDHVDYLFVRMFAFVRLVLRRSGRGG